jgi:hypothetical protein
MSEMDEMTLVKKEERRYRCTSAMCVGLPRWYIAFPLTEVKASAAQMGKIYDHVKFKSYHLRSATNS